MSVSVLIDEARRRRIEAIATQIIERTADEFPDEETDMAQELLAGTPVSHLFCLSYKALHAMIAGGLDDAEYDGEIVIPDAASTPPHEQQNEPSSSPSRAPGDEPAGPPMPEGLVEEVAKIMRLAAVLGARDGVAEPLCDWEDLSEGSRENYRRAVRNYFDSVSPVGGAEREPRTSPIRAEWVDGGLVIGCDHGMPKAVNVNGGHFAPSSAVLREPRTSEAPFALPVRTDVSFFTPIGKERIAVVRLLDAAGTEVAKFVESPDDVEKGHDWLIRCAWFIADCINARRAAPPSTSPEENERNG